MVKRLSKVNAYFFYYFIWVQFYVFIIIFIVLVQSFNFFRHTYVIFSLFLFIFIVRCISPFHHAFTIPFSLEYHMHVRCNYGNVRIYLSSYLRINICTMFLLCVHINVSYVYACVCNVSNNNHSANCRHRFSLSHYQLEAQIMSLSATRLYFADEMK